LEFESIIFIAGFFGKQQGRKKGHPNMTKETKKIKMNLAFASFENNTKVAKKR
jgi:hypothetical protein